MSNQRHSRVLQKLSVAPVIALLLIMAAVLPGTIAAQSLSNDTTIRILIDGREFILPHPRINAYDPPVNTASLTLDISAIQKSARITRITPADADRNTPGHQISVDTSPLVYDNTLVEVEVTAQDGTKRSTDLLIRGFSCHDDLGLGRVASLRGACIILDLISVKVPYSHTMEYAEEQFNRRSGWTVTWRAESIRWLFATRNPDNLSLQQLQQEASGIKAQPWASLVELQSTVQHDDDGIGDPGDAGTGDFALVLEISAPEPQTPSPEPGARATTRPEAVERTMCARWRLTARKCAGRLR